MTFSRRRIFLRAGRKSEEQKKAQKNSGSQILLPEPVEHSGFEPLTPTLPVWCATSCANAPRTLFILPHSQRLVKSFLKSFFKQPSNSPDNLPAVEQKNVDTVRENVMIRFQRFLRDILLTHPHQLCLCNVSLFFTRFARFGGKIADLFKSGR